MATTSTNALLTRGRITLRGRMPNSSNATFLAELDLDGASGLAVYKPARGERPLWDFGGEPIPAGFLADLRGFLAAPLPAELAALLAPAERAALEGRAHALVKGGRFPTDASGVRYPWPLV